MYLNEMAQFLLDEYNVTANTITIFYVLKKAGWSRKAVSCNALQQSLSILVCPVARDTTRLEA